MPNDTDKTLPPSAAASGDAKTQLQSNPSADSNPSNSLTIDYPTETEELFGRYRIERKLGEGGMGTVFLAHDTLLDRPVAIKIPKFIGNVELATQRFHREARAAASFQHPNICPIYDIGQIGGTHYLAMAFVAGETLSARTRSQKKLAPSEAARIVRQIALAMQFAHARGVIHRDLKPANILIDPHGEPIIMDFGLARRDSRDQQLTVQGEVMGTPNYMPPEQVEGAVAQMGPASDIYALGSVLYELLTGSPPFTGDFYALVGQILSDVPVAPSTRCPGLDPRFDVACLKALAKKPEDRWKSMQAFADVLGGLTEAAGARCAGGPHLTLRVAGTHFAYRPPPMVPTVTVGRQKRRPGDPPDQGNDFVLRVAGNDGLSARISRRHFELQRQPDGWSIIDRSKTGVTRNGQPLAKDQPVPLADGDRLGIAGVVTLEVLMQPGSLAEGVKHAAIVEVPTPADAGAGHVQIEASVGDMVTVE